jgi:hypothetical protein
VQVVCFGIDFAQNKEGHGEQIVGCEARVHSRIKAQNYFRHVLKIAFTVFLAF